MVPMCQWIMTRCMSIMQNECRRLLQELLHAAALQTSNLSAAYQSGAGALKVICVSPLHCQAPLGVLIWPHDSPELEWC